MRMWQNKISSKELKDVLNMEEERGVVEQGRIIFFTNEFEKIKIHYRELKELAIKSNPSDENYIQYLELVFNRAIEEFIKKTSILE